MIKRAIHIAVLCGLGLSLAACDKCGDYFWIQTATPQSCKETTAR